MYFILQPRKHHSAVMNFPSVSIAQMASFACQQERDAMMVMIVEILQIKIKQFAVSIMYPTI